MRIFFVTNNYTPYAGGVVTSITTITQALRAQGHEVFIITLNFLGKKHHDPEFVIRITCPIRFKYKKNYMAIPWRPTHAIDELIKKYNPDIIHVQHPFLLGVSALHAAHKYNIPCIFTYHTLYEEYAHYLPIPRICAQPLIRTAVKTFCDKVDAIIAPSTYVKKHLEKQHIKTPIDILVSPLRTCFKQDTIPSKVISNHCELILVTRFVLEKNIPFVFKVMQLLPQNFRLKLVGYGNDYEKLKDLAYNVLKLAPDRLQFIHKPDQEKLVQLYRNAHLFVFPSQTDTQAIVLAESMSQATPVIAIEGPGQKDIIKNGINGFIVKNVQEMADKIIDIANNAQEYQRLIAGAYVTAAHYDAHNIVKKLLHIYHATIQKKEASG
jgi:glycosyltransferase involved in cell wall biosynthesis